MKKILSAFILFAVFFTLQSSEAKLPFDVKEYTLKNGMKLFLSKNKSAPRLQTYIAVRAGSADESRESTGLAHYFEHMMFKGSSKIASLDWEKEKPLLDKIEELFELHRNTTDAEKRTELYRQIDAVSQEAAKYSNNEYWQLLSSIGARGTNAWTSFDETVYTNDIPVNQLEKFLFLETERFNNIALRRFHTELETVYEEFNRMQDRDATIAYYAMLGKLFPTHPYGRNVIGLPEHIKAPSMKDIHRFFEEYYVPENMALIIVGDLDFDKTFMLADKYLGSLPRKTLSAHKSDRKLKEDPITKSEIVEITGPDRELLYMAFRFDSNEKTNMMLDLISDILSNGKTGLIDVNLIQPQKVQSASAGYHRLREYSTLIFRGEPREGQTLEQLKDLLLAEITKLKKGAFDSHMIKAIADNYRYQFITIAENRENTAYQIVDSFINGEPIENKLRLPDKIEHISIEEVMTFANKYLNDNYVLVYKRSGTSQKVKAEQPLITPVEIPENYSAFAEKFAAIPSDVEPEPVFIDFKTSMTKIALKDKLDFYHIPNKDNERFSLSYVFPAGKLNDLKIPFVFEYANLLGTDKFTQAQLKNEFFRLAMSYSIKWGADSSSITINGLQRNFDDALKVLEHLIHNISPDQETYDKYVETVYKNRENAKKSPDSIQGATQNYALYGKVNPLTDRLTIDELKQLNPKELTNYFSALPSMRHDIVYYGPEDIGVITKKITKIHETPPIISEFPEKKKYKENIPSENLIFAVTYPGAQARVLVIRLDTPFSLDKLGFASIFYPYAGRIVSREIREKRGMAYTAYSFYSLPDDLEELSIAGGFIGTQPDKLEGALTELLRLMENIPQTINQFESAKIQGLQGVRSDRVVREGIFSLFLRARKRGLDFDWRKQIYEETNALTMDEFDKMFKEHVAGKKSLIVLVGDLNAIKQETLEKFGKLQILTLDDIFEK